MRNPVILTPTISPLGALLFLVITIGVFGIPLNTSHEVLYKNHITANYAFAGDLTYKGSHLPASVELCSYIWLHPEIDTFPVVVKEYLFFEKRYLVTQETIGNYLVGE